MYNNVLRTTNIWWFVRCVVLLRSLFELYSVYKRCPYHFVCYRCRGFSWSSLTAPFPWWFIIIIMTIVSWAKAYLPSSFNAFLFLARLAVFTLNRKIIKIWIYANAFIKLIMHNLKDCLDACVVDIRSSSNFRLSKIRYIGTPEFESARTTWWSL